MSKKELLFYNSEKRYSEIYSMRKRYSKMNGKNIFVDNLEDIDIKKSNNLDNPQNFQRKNDIFSSYSKGRKSTALPTRIKVTFDFKISKKNSDIIMEKPEFKRFSKKELIPRGFAIQIKERIIFLEKRMLENLYTINDLTDYQKKYYDNNEPRNFDLSTIKPESIKKLSFNYIGKNQNKHKQNNKDNNNKNNNKDNNILKNKSEKNNQKKSFKNLVVDYSKIINSSKIKEEPKELDDFLKLKKRKKINIDDKENNENTDKNDENKKLELSLSLISLKDGEVSTNFSHALNQDKNTNKKHIRQKSEGCNYNDLLSKIAEFENGNNKNPSLNKVVNAFRLFETKKENNNDKYFLIKKKNNKLSVEKKNRYKKYNYKKVLYNSIPDNMALDRLDKAKIKLNQENNNNLIKNQINEILEKLVNEKSNNNKKIKNLKEIKKIDKAVEIIPQLLLIKQKINILLMSNENFEINGSSDNMDENAIKKSVSTIYILECLGIDPKILFDDNEIENIEFINDVSENIQLNGALNKFRYLKYYFQNIKKANIFLEILIDNINKLQLSKDFL